jgi:hypothetical protein
MDTEKALQEAQAKQKELVDKANQLEQERQVIIQELLRLDGEIRVFKRIDEGEHNANK